LQCDPFLPGEQQYPVRVPRISQTHEDLVKFVARQTSGVRGWRAISSIFPQKPATFATFFDDPSPQKTSESVSATFQGRAGFCDKLIEDPATPAVANAERGPIASN
jgi:hypothetical protein